MHDQNVLPPDSPRQGVALLRSNGAGGLPKPPAPVWPPVFLYPALAGAALVPLSSMKVEDKHRQVNQPGDLLVSGERSFHEQEQGDHRR